MAGILPVSLAAIGVLICWKWLWDRVKRLVSGVHLPPGPPGISLLGNILDVPAVDSHLAFYDFAKKYGPIMHFQMLNQSLIVLSNAKIATELLEKRGAIYSDRPILHMANAAGWEWSLANMGHNDAWRARRRVVHQHFYANATVHMHDMIRRTCVELLRDFLDTPDNFSHHIRRSAAANIMSTLYGINVAHENDPYVAMAEEAIDVVGKIILPGNTPVDVLPFLLKVPVWVPYFGQWTKIARDTRRLPTDASEVPFARTKADMSLGVAPPSMVALNLEAINGDGDSSVTEQVIKDAAAVSYIAGADTTVSTLIAFVMAMVCWPEYQKKAQDELDRALGDRLPELSDQASLPYVEAIIRETYRMYPVTPLGVPHAVEEDDIYQGMLIPKGATVASNVWAIMHDESIYPEAHRFNPDRWMDGGEINRKMQDPRVAGTFGFGRRICPGRYFADASVYLSISMALKCFDFGVYMENGVAVPPSGKMITGIVSCPAPFKCSITPRSDKARRLVDIACDD